jgi:hypothetical protein
VVSAILKRLEALEERIASRDGMHFVFCWTPSLARRIEPSLPSNYQPVHLSFPDIDAEEAFEASLRKDNPKEAARLDALLRGEIP